MKAVSIARNIAVSALMIGFGISVAQNANADTLTFQNTPAANAAAEINQKYGIGVVFRGSVDVTRQVTFSIADAATPEGRLQAVSSLASALGLRLQKVYVVSKIDPGAALPKTQVDSTGRVSFSSNRVAAHDAIETVAGADAATAQISGAITGDVTFSRTNMSVPDAAAEVAKQTQTQWKVYYALYAPGAEPQRLAGRIVDYTANGSPITQLPLVVYVPRDPPAKEEPALTASATPPAANDSSAAGYNSYGYGGYPNYGNSGMAPLQGAFGQPNVYTVPNTGFSLPAGYSGPIFTSGYGYTGFGY